MSARKPYSSREPDCVHSHPEQKQPMSACSTCQDSPVLQQWRDEWDAWLAENPDSEEAVYVRELNASCERGGGAWWKDPVQAGNLTFSVNANLAYNRQQAAGVEW